MPTTANNQYNWPNPSRRKWYRGFEQRSLDLPLPTPFYQIDWPSPKRVRRLSSYNWIQTSPIQFPVPPIPIRQNSWPLSFRRTPIQRSFSLNLLETTLSIITPVVSLITGGRQITEAQVLSSWMKAIRRMGR